MRKYKIIHTPFYYFTLLSLVILLVISGGLIFIYLYSGELDVRFREQIRILVELGDSSKRQAVTDLLKQTPGVQTESITWVPKEEALAMMQREMGDDVIFEDMPNPFLDVIQFQVAEAYMERDSLLAIEAVIESAVEDIDLQFPSALFGDTQRILNQISFYASISILVLLILVIVLIHHLMRLNVIANRFMIHTMQMVGAAPGFIRRPFLTEALRLAIYATIIAGAILAVLWYWMTHQTMILPMSLPLGQFALTLGIMFLACALICGYSTLTALAKRLSASSESLY